MYLLLPRGTVTCWPLWQCYRSSWEHTADLQCESIIHLKQTYRNTQLPPPATKTTNTYFFGPCNSGLAVIWIWLTASSIVKASDPSAPSSHSSSSSSLFSFPGGFLWPFSIFFPGAGPDSCSADAQSGDVWPGLRESVWLSHEGPHLFWKDLKIIWMCFSRSSWPMGRGWLVTADMV